MRVRFTILGEPASKANSRQAGLSYVKGGGEKRVTIRKSDKALEYEASAQKQIPPTARVMFEGPVRVTMTIFYASERPDLDESVILDVLQAKFKTDPNGKRVCTFRGVYINDRQVRSKRIDHGIDKANPRAEIMVEPLTAQQAVITQTKVLDPADFRLS